MRFFRKIQISNPKYLKKLENESVSNGTIKSLESDIKNLETPNNKGEKYGNANEGFEMVEKESRKERFENSVQRSEENPTKSSKEAMVRIEISKHKRRCYTCKNLYGRIGHWLDHPRLIHWLTLAFLGLATWCIIQSVAGSEFLPGSQLFSLLALFVLAYVAGALTEIIRLPALLGMLLMGLLLRNIGFINVEGVYKDITATLREITLCFVLIRAGLGLDPKALKSLSRIIFRLAAVPGTVEAIITMTIAHFMLDLPWLWGILLGSILAAVSPAVVIPCLFSLQERGYGTGKGIPTLVVAAASLDDILAITVFGVLLDIIFSNGKSITMQLLQGLLGVIIGIVYGIVWGFVAQFIPHQKDSYAVLLRVLMVTGGGLMAVIGSRVVGFQGAGPLGCITAAFVACLGWRKQDYSEEHNPVAKVFRVIWTVFQPILFGLIGTEVNVHVLELSTVWNGLLVLFCSLLGRIVTTVLIAVGYNFNWKEKTFIAWAWFPKATVQAALGPFLLDMATLIGTEEDVVFAKRILIIAVLAILVTAPTGAILITVLGPKLLTKADGKSEKEEVEEVVSAREAS